ncbi:hypothetical protein BDN72DRAFT_965371 [Pluteus cervinus]|uniref:Uncharacterized protein n=1 Tax=Pluteus cervinus TaxID=181527 RepID=A0ACD3A5H3_9AGAR|nr:hypothetical protein BDN72DRAFT_965371 [Pluteus cervinus]
MSPTVRFATSSLSKHSKLPGPGNFMGSHTIIVDFQETSISKVDDQIQTLRCYLQKLLIARNALAPIHRLPPDILLEIFAIFYARLPTWHDLSMLRLTWVSHHWRELALGTPTLWSDVSTPHLSAAKWWLARTGSAPLSVRLLNVTKKVIVPVIPELQFILEQIHRISILRYSQRSSDVFKLDIPESVWEEPALLLDFLELKGVVLHGRFLSSVPNVWNMVLRRCKFSWDAGRTNFLELTHLDIAFPQSTIPVAQLLGLLQRMPSLECLVVIHVFATDDDQDTFVPSPTLQFPQLHTLKLGFGKAIDPPLQFLRHALSSFTTSQTMISCSFDAARLEHNRLHTQFLPSFSEVVSPQRVVAIKVTSPQHYTFGEVVINFRTTKQESSRMNLQIETSTSQHRSLCSILQEGLTLTHLEAIRFSRWGLRDPSGFVTMFGELPNLSYVDWGCTAMDLFEDVSLIEDGIARPPLASVKIFGFLECTWKNNYKPLAQFLVQRQRLGYELETITLDLTGSRPDDNTLAELNKLVDVVWEDSPEMVEIQSVFEGPELIWSRTSTGVKLADESDDDSRCITPTDSDS